ncbi:hypothetical protein GGR42_000614 [Saonia flava]|uniref:Uncharacterized protein n=1 Tax=Saonia flava TaxID=523696 RepID=A0A846QUD6_9FLAO|nr:hypothetical protein [Saonia flava]NJB70152.1 hypothetical protein [Saonia flava]
MAKNIGALSSYILLTPYSGLSISIQERNEGFVRLTTNEKPSECSLKAVGVILNTVNQLNNMSFGIYGLTFFFLNVEHRSH